MKNRKRLDVTKAAAKSVWREQPNQPFAYYCPCCASPRRLGMHPKPGRPIHFLQVGITAVFITLITAHFLPWIGMKAIVCFVPLWILFETVYRAKVRVRAACDKCGFDPILYLVEPAQAREAIRAHWRMRFEEKGIPFPEDDAENNALHSRLHASSDRVPAATAQKRRTNPSVVAAPLEDEENL